MSRTITEHVSRTPEEPTPADVLNVMDVCEPYSAGELAGRFENASRWTIQDRLETLNGQGHIRKKKHNDRRVSWWIDVNGKGCY